MHSYQANYKANPPHSPGVGVVLPSAPPHSSRVDMDHPIPATPPILPPGSTRQSHFEPHQSKKTRSSRWLMVVGGSVLVLLLCVVVGVVVFHLAPAHKPIPAQTHPNCISCSVLEKALQKQGSTLNIAEIDVKHQDGKLLCCLKPTTKSDTFLEMLLENAAAMSQTQSKHETHEDNTSHEVSALPPPNIAPPHSVATPSPQPTFRRNLAAALVGLENPIPTTISDNEAYILKEWGTRARYPVTFIRKEIKYDSQSGRFKMPRDGLYIINVHLGLSNMNRTDINFAQRLLRYNRHFPQTKPEVLAFDSEKIPGGERRTSSLSSVFNLRKDDEIFVQVLPAHTVVEQSSRSYLSVFLLSE